MTVTFNTQAQWAAGPTQVNVDSSTVPNHLKADFASSAAGVNSNWIQTSEMVNWSVDANTTVAMGGIGSVYMVQNQVGGGIKGLQCWRANTTGSGRWDALATIPGASGVWTFIFMAQNVNSATLFPVGVLPGNQAAEYYALYHGYCLRVDSTSGGGVHRVSLQRMDANATTNTIIGTASYTEAGQAEHQFTISRCPTGLFQVFKDGALMYSATDTTYTSGSFLGFASYQSFQVCKNSPGLLKPSTSFQMAWESTSMDTSADANLWKNRFYTFSGNNVLQVGSTSAFALQTRCGNTSGTMDIFSTVANKANQAPGTSGSGQLQFMRAQILFNTITQVNNEDPDVTSLVVGKPLSNRAFFSI